MTPRSGSCHIEGVNMFCLRVNTMQLSSIFLVFMLSNVKSMSVSMNYAADESESFSYSYSASQSFVLQGPNPEEEGEFFEGDIELDDTGTANDIKNLVRQPTKLWKDGIVYYDIDKNLSVTQTRFIEKALRNIMFYSCVQFRKRMRNEKPYLLYRTSPNKKTCSAHVGFTGKDVNYVNLGKTCYVLGIVQHETLHALGFWHEQTRPDRDKYVDVHFNAIKKGNEVNFKKRNPKEARTLDLPYDFGSIMHYSRFAFSKDGKTATLTPKKVLKNIDDKKIGQRIHISQMDLAKLNNLYDCPNKYYKARDKTKLKFIQSRPVKIK